MKTQDFKETPIGKIPKEWKLIELGNKNISKNMYYGITAKATEEDTKLRMLRTTDIENYDVDWENLPNCKITEEINNIEKYLLEKNDMIIARAGTTGVSVLVDESLQNAVFGSYLIKVELKESVDPKFIHFFLQSPLYWSHIQAHQRGSTMNNINLSILESIKLPLPPLSEQEKIAEVLSTVDGAIQKVDGAIEKTERLKKGLMQKLLIEGIDHEELKETPIGRIPKEWDVMNLKNGDIVDIVMGSSPPSSTYNKEGEGLPFLQGNAEFGEIRPTPVKYCSEPQKIAEKGDILLSVRAPVGDVNIAKSKCCIGRGLSAIRPNEKSLKGVFLYYYLDFSSKRFEKLSLGSTFSAIRKNEIQNFKIPLPPLSEQEKIAEILSKVDEKLVFEKKRKEKFNQIKKGLMLDLLTGRKRVEV
ncbi:hypothetical protein AKJ64_02860 [candidate division MSBL1 archaeon SCGC-AAA259E17]|uniref:Type I restriction modification DNA specificity domain-containing protein n=1 Tax=candidate division MSBL1 archaeon SCGC-AAA259E17 TaxID=1698263 RepID=A0A133UEH6_9EURY|nr:hypothetical protein AKJ64_02860 [candidate division MSBL1 archaeon SCGC-AAA259E17]